MTLLAAVVDAMTGTAGRAVAVSVLTSLAESAVLAFLARGLAPPSTEEPAPEPLSRSVRQSSSKGRLAKATEPVPTSRRPTMRSTRRAGSRRAKHHRLAADAS